MEVFSSSITKAHLKKDIINHIVSHTYMNIVRHIEDNFDEGSKVFHLYWGVDEVAEFCTFASVLKTMCREGSLMCRVLIKRTVTSYFKFCSKWARVWTQTAHKQSETSTKRAAILEHFWGTFWGMLVGLVKQQPIVTIMLELLR